MVSFSRDYSKDISLSSGGEIEYFAEYDDFELMHSGFSWEYQRIEAEFMNDIYLPEVEFYENQGYQMPYNITFKDSLGNDFDHNNSYEGGYDLSLELGDREFDYEDDEYVVWVVPAVVVANPHTFHENPEIGPILTFNAYIVVVE